MAGRGTSFVELYGRRPLSAGFPDLESLGVAQYSEHQHLTSKIGLVFECLTRLIDLANGPRTVTVVGCGPNPESVKELLSLGYDAVGVEPVVGSAMAGRQYLGDEARVRVGTAEQLPVADASQQVVVMESVLEHVDSPIASVAEAYRALVPGGVLYLTTNNPYLPRTSEFRPWLYPWYPRIVKECYVFRHLHYDPSLASYTPRPAVHWLTFSELCRLGRTAGFAHFYSLVDLIRPDAPYIQKSALRRLSLGIVQQNPWARALALLLIGGRVIMYKRPDAPPADGLRRAAAEGRAAPG